MATIAPVPESPHQINSLPHGAAVSGLSLSHSPFSTQPQRLCTRPHCMGPRSCVAVLLLYSSRVYMGAGIPRLGMQRGIGAGGASSRTITLLSQSYRTTPQLARLLKLCCLAVTTQVQDRQAVRIYSRTLVLCRWMLSVLMPLACGGGVRGGTRHTSTATLHQVLHDFFSHVVVEQLLYWL